jgi:cytochrome c553
MAEAWRQVAAVLRANHEDELTVAVGAEMPKPDRVARPGRGRRAKTIRSVLLPVAILAAAGAGKVPSSTAALDWAFPSGKHSIFDRPLPPGPFHVPGSRLTFTKAQLESDYVPPDWFPADHGPVPAVVAHGGPGKPTPCAMCHLSNGSGFPGAPDLAGLPVPYIVSQVHAFRNGSRRSAQADSLDTAHMIKVAMAVSEPDLARAAAYFSGLPHSRWVRVVETDRAPRTVPDQYGWRDPAPGGGTEPIGNRVIELSNDIDRAILHDDHVGITDYVPRGAIARGGQIVAHSPQPCTSCHGSNLAGSGVAPPLAGRPAAYLARQIWNFRTGARHDANAQMMAAPASALSPSDIVAVTAYLAARR